MFLSSYYNSYKRPLLQVTMFRITILNIFSFSSSRETSHVKLVSNLIQVARLPTFA